MVLIMTRASLYPIREWNNMRKSSTVEDEMEVVKYTEQPHEPEEETIGGNDANDNVPPFKSVPASV